MSEEKASENPMISRDCPQMPSTIHVTPTEGSAVEKSSKIQQTRGAGTASSSQAQAASSTDPNDSADAPSIHPLTHPIAFPSRSHVQTAARMPVPPGHSFPILLHGYPMPPPFPMRYMSSSGFSDVSLPLPHLAYSHSFGVNGCFGPPILQSTTTGGSQSGTMTHPSSSFKTPTYHSRTGSSGSTSVSSSDLDIAASALLELTPSVQNQLGASKKGPPQPPVDPLTNQEATSMTSTKSYHWVTPYIPTEQRHDVAMRKTNREMPQSVPHTLDRHIEKPSEVTPSVHPLNVNQQKVLPLSLPPERHTAETNDTNTGDAMANPSTAAPTKKPFHLSQKNLLPQSLPPKRKTVETIEFADVSKRHKQINASANAKSSHIRVKHAPNALPNDLAFLLENSAKFVEQAKQLIQESKVSEVACKCKNTKCLKLYCSCFQAGNLCDPEICSCKGCENTAECSVPGGSRAKVILETLKRRPDAFEKRLRKKTGEGCHCRKTRCLRKYCDCFANKTYCSSICGCTDCLNVLPNNRHPLQSLEFAYSVDVSAQATVKSDGTNTDV